MRMRMQARSAAIQNKKIDNFSPFSPLFFSFFFLFIQRLSVRKKEHSDAIRLGQCSKSAIAEHVHDHPSPPEMDWSTSQVVDRACRQDEQRVREAFYIYKRQPKINRDTGLERSAVWNAVL